MSFFLRGLYFIVKCCFRFSVFVWMLAWLARQRKRDFKSQWDLFCLKKRWNKPIDGFSLLLYGLQLYHHIPPYAIWLACFLCCWRQKVHPITLKVFLSVSKCCLWPLSQIDSLNKSHGFLKISIWRVRFLEAHHWVCLLNISPLLTIPEGLSSFGLYGHCSSPVIITHSAPWNLSW